MKYRGEPVTWEFLKQLDQLCGQMKREGRLTPFNSLELTYPVKAPIHDHVDEISYSNLTASELRLKYIGILGWSSVEEDCRCHMHIVTLLKHKDHGLKSLKVDSTRLLYDFKNNNAGWLPHFPQLEELDLAIVDSFGRNDAADVKRKEMLAWLLRDAPNLKRIHAGRLSVLQFVPAGILKRVTLGGQLSVRLERKQDLNTLVAVSDKGCGLNDIRISTPDSYCVGGNVAKVPVDPKARQQYDSAVEHLLQSAHQCLKTIYFGPDYPLGNLSHPPLSKLTSFKF